MTNNNPNKRVYDMAPVQLKKSKFKRWHKIGALAGLVGLGAQCLIVPQFNRGNDSNDTYEAKTEEVRKYNGLGPAIEYVDNSVIDGPVIDDSVPEIRNFVYLAEKDSTDEKETRVIHNNHVTGSASVFEDHSPSSRLIKAVAKYAPSMVSELKVGRGGIVSEWEDGERIYTNVITKGWPKMVRQKVGETLKDVYDRIKTKGKDRLTRGFHLGFDRANKEGVYDKIVASVGTLGPTPYTGRKNVKFLPNPYTGEKDEDFVPAKESGDFEYTNNDTKKTYELADLEPISNELASRNTVIPFDVTPLKKYVDKAVVSIGANVDLVKAKAKSTRGLLEKILRREEVASVYTPVLKGQGTGYGWDMGSDKGEKIKLASNKDVTVMGWDMYSKNGFTNKKEMRFS